MMIMKLVRTGVYARALKRLSKLGATRADVEAMEDAIAFAPETGEVIPGGGGLRKMRFAYGQVGKRGGGRTIYYALLSDGVIYLITAYAKVDKSDLTAEETRLFKALVKELNDVRKN
jgi:hypothetical protein